MSVIPEAAVEAAGLAWCGRVELRDWQRRHITKLLEAAAPHMQQVIATVEELDALPFETVIRDAEGHVLERWGDDPANVWVTIMVSAFIPRGDIALPATIIYRPTP